MRLVDERVGIERLTSLDAGFLVLETADTPMHMGSVTYLDGAPLRDEHGRIRLTELRQLVEARLALAPRFRQRPVASRFGIGRPVWEDDPSFDVASHVNEVVLPAPGSEHQLREFVAQLMMRTLERSRPLWELWVVDGYADGYVVLVEKIHHVMMDGISGVDVAMLLTDPGSEVGEVARPEEPPPRSANGAARLVADVVDELGVPFSVLGAPVRASAILADSLRHPERVPSLAREATAVARGGLSLVHRTTIAPRTPLNEHVGMRRAYDHVEAPFADLRRISKAFGCTLNDVALTAVTGGVRQLLLDQGTDPGTTFQVAVPVSTRQTAEHMTLGNKVAMFLVPLPVGMPNELAQLEAIHAVTQQRKDVGQATAVARLVGAADRWPTPIVDVIAHLVHHQPFANAVVTNVPGPQSRRYMLGARLRRIAPIVPLAGNLDVSVGIFSYDGEVSFGCYADADRCPDLRVLTDGILANLEALGVLAAQRASAAS